jgi:hypothetical protein
MTLMTHRASHLAQYNGEEAESQLADGEETTHSQNQEGDSRDCSVTREGSETARKTARAGRGKRKPNPDRDVYLQEPQYVTKQTSSGRLVKMKISRDYDYTSDQEENRKKRSKFGLFMLGAYDRKGTILTGLLRAAE